MSGYRKYVQSSVDATTRAGYLIARQHSFSVRPVLLPNGEHWFEFLSPHGFPSEIDWNEHLLLSALLPVGWLQRCQDFTPTDHDGCTRFSHIEYKATRKLKNCIAWYVMPNDFASGPRIGEQLKAIFPELGT